MTGRLFASLVWLPVLLLTPLRRAFGTVALVFWPSARLDNSLLLTPVRLAFVAVVLAVAYAATAWLAERLIVGLRAHADPEDEVVRAHGGDGIFALALFVTIVWAVVGLVLRCLDLPLVAAAILMIVGLSGGRETPVVPTPAPMPVPVPPQPLPEPDAGGGSEDADGDAAFARVYAWLFNEEPHRKNGREYSFKTHLVVPREVYTGFKNRPHAVETPSSFVEFATAELDDEVVTAVATRLRGIVSEHGYDRLSEIHLAMAFTLSLRYASDEDEFGGEYPRFPVETLVDKRGDCEDHAILCGAILYRLGHRVALVLMDTGPKVGHAALAVEAPVPVEGVSFHSSETGTEMFYCEVTPGDVTTETTTDVQWWLGMAPPKEASGFRVFPISGAKRKHTSGALKSEMKNHAGPGEEEGAL
jgi:predicted transglutaminase-like cysteine proteinase